MIFLNLPQWRNFQESVGRKIFNLGDGFLIKLDIPLGKSYLYSNYSDALEHIDEIRKIGRAESAIFFKWEPLLEQQAKSNKQQELKELGFKKSAKELQPQRTIILNLEKSEEELLKQMEQKTRYNVRLAQKRGVEVILSENKQNDFEKLWDLLVSTSRRDNFNLHAKDYYKKLLDIDIVRLYIAQKDGKPASAAVVVFTGDTATYLHGASNHELRRHMAPYRMHWKIVQDAKDENLKYYDLWGIDEKKWPGVTRFKNGFSGKKVEYIGSWDLPLNTFWYMLYRVKNIL